jgi:hypothetical protein
LELVAAEELVNMLSCFFGDLMSWAGGMVSPALPGLSLSRESLFEVIQLLDGALSEVLPDILLPSIFLISAGISLSLAITGTVRRPACSGVLSLLRIAVRFGPAAADPVVSQLS